MQAASTGGVGGASVVRVSGSILPRRGAGRASLRKRGIGRTARVARGAVAAASGQRQWRGAGSGEAGSRRKWRRCCGDRARRRTAGWASAGSGTGAFRQKDRKIITSVRCAQQGSTAARVPRERSQSITCACGAASSRSWNLPSSLNSQSSNNSSWPRPLRSRVGGCGSGDARRSVASAVLSASSSPLVR